MYSIIGVLFCILEGILIAKFGWIALLWSSLGFALSLFLSANIVLPLLLGIPMASSRISRKEMRPSVYAALLRAPIIWVALFLIVGWIFPSAVDWVSKNETLCVGIAFGFIAVLFSPLSKKTRTDFRIDFDKSYGRYYVTENGFDKSQEKQAGAVIKIASNLYYNDFVNSFDDLKFQLSDGRFRCLILSLSITIKACEDLLKSPALLQNECLHFLSNLATTKEHGREFFNQQISPEQAKQSGAAYLKKCDEYWSKYYDYIVKEDLGNAKTLLLSLIHSVESDVHLQESDRERLGQLCWQIEFSLAHKTMRDAFISLTSK
jgi:hypothetical protein